MALGHITMYCVPGGKKFAVNFRFDLMSVSRRKATNLAHIPGHTVTREIKLFFKAEVGTVK